MSLKLVNYGFFMFLSLIVKISSAQPDHFHDDLNFRLSQKPTLWINLHNNFSFISGVPVQTRSVKGGLNFGDRLKFGLGYNWLSKSLEIEEDQKSKELKLNYAGLIIEYEFYESLPWSFSIPVQIGGGYTYYNDIDSGDNSKGGGIILYEPSMLAHYHFLDYFSLSGGVGLRLNLLNTSEIEQQYSSPIFILRIQIDFRKIYEDGSRS